MDFMIWINVFWNLKIKETDIQFRKNFSIYKIRKVRNACFISDSSIG